MSGSRSKKKSSTVPLSGMVTSVVDVEIDEVDLIDAGWIRSDDDQKRLDAVVNEVEFWHGANHSGSFLWCTEHLCADVVKASGK